jgi:hypothetical protein
MNIRKCWTLLLWVLPSGILGWREAKAETAKRKAKNIEENRVTAIWSWKKRGVKRVLVSCSEKAELSIYGSEVDG